MPYPYSPAGATRAFRAARKRYYIRIETSIDKITLDISIADTDNLTTLTCRTDKSADCGIGANLMLQEYFPFFRLSV